MRIIFLFFLFIYIFKTNNVSAEEQIIISNWEYSWGNKNKWEKITLPNKIPNRSGNLLYLKTKLPDYNEKKIQVYF